MFHVHRFGAAVGACALVCVLAACTAASPSTSTAATSTATLAATTPTSAPASTTTTSVASSAAATAKPSSSAGAIVVSSSTVVPFITLADVSSDGLDVSAVIGGVTANGTCTLKAQLGSVVRTVTQSAIPTAQSTGCGILSIPRSQLSAGDWSVTVAFSSAHQSGVSAAKTVTVGAE